MSLYEEADNEPENKHQQVFKVNPTNITIPKTQITALKSLIKQKQEAVKQPASQPV